MQNPKNLKHFTIPAISGVIGSLSNDVGVGNENGKKILGSDKQNNNSARAARMFVPVFAVFARLRRETS